MDLGSLQVSVSAHRDRVQPCDHSRPCCGEALRATASPQLSQEHKAHRQQHLAVVMQVEKLWLPQIPVNHYNLYLHSENLRRPSSTASGSQHQQRTLKLCRQSSEQSKGPDLPFALDWLSFKNLLSLGLGQSELQFQPFSCRVSHTQSSKTYEA